MRSDWSKTHALSEYKTQKKLGIFENTRLHLMFSKFPLPIEFYHSVVHSLGFFIC